MTSDDLSALSLFPATPDQITEARRRTHLEWGKGLTLEEHLTRDANQDQFEGSLDGRLIIWVLAPRNDPQTLNFKCACETYVRQRLFKRIGLVANAHNKNGVETVPCYGIASVFTPPENRGKGFARHMMRLLHWVIADEALLPLALFPAAWGAPPPVVPGTRDGRFSALWSDVGEFYAACGPSPYQKGWVVRGTATTLWEVDASTSLVSAASSSGDWTWLDNAGLLKLWEEDAGEIRLAMEKVPLSGGASFTYLPTRGVASFQHRRLDLFLQRMPSPPQTWGVSSASKSTYATWVIDPRKPATSTLTVTRIHVADPVDQSFKDLLCKIFEIAKKHDVKRVEIWNLAAELQRLTEELGAKTFSREEHLPAFKWYGPESEEAVTWAFNERFCWC
ncbi:hypothetical protein R3P38DRAFT_58207 [Favolaschia claudopus]|uniref:LYC1 C-terminal domain-containing protein n=1 Tax=Favolaschia claudopus TaxID=2862362 RepID=A0AAW0EHG0_9AGAR